MQKFQDYLVEDKNTHLEHLEDEIINNGSKGAKTAIEFLKSIKQMLQGGSGGSTVSVKWDGAPAVFCGINPENGKFFVGTKSIFNKTPKINYTNADISRNHGGALADKLKICLKYLPSLGISGILQGDLLFTSGDKKGATVAGQKSIIFTPNTITYAIPTDHEIGKKVSKAQVGVVFHTHYTGQDFLSMQAVAGAKVKSSNDVFAIDNDTPMHKVGLDHQEEVKFDKHVSDIEKMCKTCGDFLDELVTKKGTTGDEKWHIASYVKQFFNAEIKAARSVSNIDKSFEGLYNFYYDKTKLMLNKIKTPANRVSKSDLVYKSQNYLRDNQSKFKSMLGLYKELQTVKQMVIDKLDKLETFKTFVRTDQGYKVTGPEGYVMHKDGDMIKFVNRLEFSYNNFTVAKSWR